MVGISIFDTFPIIVGFLALVIAATAIIYTYTAYISAVQTTGLMNASSIALNQTKKVGNTLLAIDPLLQLVFIIMMIATVVGATMLNSNPVGYAVGFVFLLFFIYASSVISNVGHQIFVNPQLNVTASTYLSQSIHILAIAPVYQIFFVLLYLSIIAGRNIFFSQQQPQVLPNE